jgi:hypothetical protein
MGTYFTILGVLFAVLVVTSYQMAATVHLDRWDDNAAPRSAEPINDNGTSDCFDRRYSPRIRECGGLLMYSPPPLRRR